MHRVLQPSTVQSKVLLEQVHVPATSVLDTNTLS